MRLVPDEVGLLPRAVVLAAALLAVLGVAPARAEPSTPLLQDDLRAGKRTTIDAPKDSLDAELDSALGDAQGFSTKSLAAVEDRLRDELRRERPRASPRLVVFVYPGRVSMERLRAMREIFVDIELTIDPCSRSLCDDALAHHVELVGRAVGQPSLRGPGYTLTYKTLTLKAETDVRGDELITLEVPVADAVAAAQRPGGGRALLASRRRAESDYVPLLTKAIAQRAAQQRVPLVGAPEVTRGPGRVDIGLGLRPDRVRAEQQRLDALRAIGQALRANPATPKDGRIELRTEASGRGARPTRYRCPIEPAELYADGRLDGRNLLGSYVEQVNEDKDAQRMDFDDGPGSGDDAGPAGAPNDDEALAVLAAHFDALGGCARAQAQRSASFRGVTIVLAWAANGRVEKVDVKEPQLRGTPLPACLRQALAPLRLPRFSGGTRTIEYPIRLK